MRVLKYILKWVGFLTAHLVVFGICLLSKLGIAKHLCREFKSSMVLGAGGGEYIRGDYEKAYETLLPYLNVEDDFVHSGMKYHLELLFYYGRGVTLNKPIANKLFEEAVLLGWEDAQKYMSQYHGQNKART